MAERPILFNGAMVRAILTGAKTQTRRAVKMPEGFDFIAGNGDDLDDPSNWGGEHEDGQWWALADGDGVDQVLPCPFGVPGDRLWVRETWGIWDQGFDTSEESGFTIYRADTERPEPRRWRPSIHMPREACRLVLEITAVHVERLQTISAADAEAEGLRKFPFEDALAWAWKDGDRTGHASPTGAFRALWESTGGDWCANPFVWVVGFSVVEGPCNG
ncbi:hypothetical protein [Luteimonas fraxinea]|uniref:Phage-related protein n=1 Tax=Luteimonas fraxinea TaxID=2901869 RepID=A0ABS8UEE3_9GAMM|nr:hypothetical protein [Luteimonas fraxinea]MCD9097084.1 hypothetical protein [Luteimonas fraxinea]